MPLALLTDLYQLTMAAAAWKSGLAAREAVFHLTFRRAPFHAGFTIAAGLGPALELMKAYRFDQGDLDYLASLRTAHGPLFEEGFLRWLAELKPAIDVDAIPEGTAVFPHEPLLRVSGPIVP